MIKRRRRRRRRKKGKKKKKKKKKKRKFNLLRFKGDLVGVLKSWDLFAKCNLECNSE